MKSFLASCAIFLFIASVSGVVHHNYVNNRFDEFSEDDFNEAFPAPPSSAEEEDTLMLVSVVSAFCEAKTKSRFLTLYFFSCLDMATEQLTVKPNYIQKILT